MVRRLGAGRGGCWQTLAPPTEARVFWRLCRGFCFALWGSIDHYQIWDEPNIAPHWGAREIDPAAYGLLLREAAIRIRAADPGAVILTAALAPNVEPGGANMSELRFLDALYRREQMSGLMLWRPSPMILPSPSTHHPMPEQLELEAAGTCRDVMEAHGDAQGAVWAVSFGRKQWTRGC